VAIDCCAADAFSNFVGPLPVAALVSILFEESPARAVSIPLPSAWDGRAEVNITAGTETATKILTIERFIQTPDKRSI
jgi:hypothetical protein